MPAGAACDQVAIDDYILVGVDCAHVLHIAEEIGMGDDGPAPDQLWRGNLCKHVLICRLLEGDGEVVRALREVVSI